MELINHSLENHTMMPCMKFQRNLLKNIKLIAGQKFHRTPVIVATISCQSPNFELLQCINESDACMKFNPLPNKPLFLCVYSRNR